jgi:hypothetical protein
MRDPVSEDDLGGLGPVELMELTIGPPVRGSCFRDQQSLRAAWETARAELLQRSQPGRRPQGWWQFDSGDLQYPGEHLERSTLWRLGLLDEGEKRQLEAEWLHEFNYAQAPDFSVPRPWPHEALEGHRARREHYRWADIPRELVKTWRVERRRRRKGK